MSRGKEIFPRAILGTRAMGLSTMVCCIRRVHIGLSQNVTKRHICWCFSVQPAKSIVHACSESLMPGGKLSIVVKCACAQNPDNGRSRIGCLTASERTCCDRLPVTTEIDLKKLLQF